MKILITGTAGFIGFYLVDALLKRGYNLIGVDNINEYYDRRLKLGRLKQNGIETNDPVYNTPYRSQNNSAYTFIKLDITDRDALEGVFKKYPFDAVCHLAAQAGVRYSLENPYTYIESNIIGFHNLIECIKNHGIKNFCFASTSSVYGVNTKTPFSEKDNTDHPLSLYAATKKSNELMAHVYSSLFDIQSTGLRFFTVYGPWGRPDMALFKFVKNILEDKPIDVYNHGNLKRDFTYVDDIVEGVCRVIEKPAEPLKTWNAAIPEIDCSFAPYRIYNIGYGKPVELMEFIRIIEDVLNKKAVLNMLPMQPGDVYATYADTTQLERDFDYKPVVDVALGISRFVTWYKEYYKR